MLDSLYILIFLVALFSISAYFTKKNDDQKMTKLFSGKPKRTDKDYFETYFNNTDIPEVVVGRVRATFEEQLHHDLKALEADDDFSSNYSAIWSLDSMADVEILISLEEEFDIKISNAEAESMRSIRDVCNIVADKVRSKTYSV